MCFLVSMNDESITNITFYSLLSSVFDIFRLVGRSRLLTRTENFFSRPNVRLSSAVTTSGFFSLERNGTSIRLTDVAEADEVLVVGFEALTNGNISGIAKLRVKRNQFKCICSCIGDEFDIFDEIGET